MVINKEDKSMKTIFKVSALAVMAASLLASCAKEDDFTPEMRKGETRTFTLTFAQPDTKVAVTDEGKSTWEVGDEIMIHGGKDGKERQKVTLTADNLSADHKTATITLYDMEPYDRTDVGVVSKYYAQYPAHLVPEGNMYYECRFTATNDFLMAACDVEDTFVFYNLCGLISYSVSGDFDKVVFAGNSGETVGFSTVYQVRVRKDESGMVVNYNKPGNESGDPVPMKKFEADVNPDGATANYVFLPAGAKFSEGFTFNFYKGGELKKVATTKKAVEIKPSQLLVLGNITEKLEDYEAPAQSDHQPADWAKAATDLSIAKQAPANSYVISAPGAYQIPAVKGNSTDPVGNVFDVELVWETYNNATDVVANSVIAEVDFDNDNIYFKTPETLLPGNALIAAKNDQGAIIWSWHIWIPATTIESSTFGDIYNQPLMDRNLGALVAATTSSIPVESFGLHYEWGRKDPFVGALSISDNHFAKVSGTAISVGYEMTVAETIANPATYAVFTQADSWGDWLSPANDPTLWQDDVKTIYDPCPAGYKVPKRDKNQPLHSTDLSKVTGWSEAAAEGENAAYFTLGNPATVFPYGGLVCENGKYIDHLGKRSFIWTAYCSSSPYIMDVRLGDAHKLNSTVTSRGCSVRCVKIDGWVQPEPPQPAQPGDVLWSETWTGGAKDAKPEDYTQTGTTVYGGAKVTYTSSTPADGSTTKIYIDNQMDGTTEQENLLLSKKGGTWTIAGIPTGDCGKALLSIKVNSKRNPDLSTTTAGVTIGERATGEESSKPYTYSWVLDFAAGVEAFDLTFTLTNSNNMRIDDIQLVVAGGTEPE